MRNYNLSVILVIKEKYKLFLITFLLIHFTGCATQQTTLPFSDPKKDEWFGKDKAKHFLLSFLVGAVTYTLAREGEADKDDATIIGFSFTGVCSIAKEVNDELKNKGWSYKDLVWDLIGCGTALSITNSLD